MNLNLSGWSPADILKLLIECEEIGYRIPTGFFEQIVEIFRYGIFRHKIRRHLISLGPLLLRKLYYEKFLGELQDKLEVVEKILAKKNFQSVQKDLEKISWELLLATISNRIRNKARTVFSENDLRHKYNEFLKEYPVITSTTHSLRSSLSPKCLYDIVVIDEASQVDLATGVLVLSCAKRVVVVGDENQLPNILPENEKIAALSLWQKFQPVCQAWNYAENSLLSSARQVWPDAPNTLLREHYRCHPKIAGFFNNQFYSDQLILMTNDEGESDAIQAFFTVPGNHARGHINQRQIDVIQEEIIPSLQRAGITDIGVIAPYRAQVALLKKLLGNEIEIDTVHGFQGREKQAIIMSTVDNEIGDFVDDPKMLNVAVSRAKRSFSVVLAQGQDRFHTNFGDLIRYVRHQSQKIVQSRVRSVFDLLYKNYAVEREKFFKNRVRKSMWDSENLIEALVNEILNDNEFRRMRLACMRHVPYHGLVLILQVYLSVSSSSQITRGLTSIC